jgi:hypothetical protein
LAIVESDVFFLSSIRLRAFSVLSPFFSCAISLPQFLPFPIPQVFHPFILSQPSQPLLMCFNIVDNICRPFLTSSRASSGISSRTPRKTFCCGI